MWKSGDYMIIFPLPKLLLFWSFHLATFVLL